MPSGLILSKWIIGEYFWAYSRMYYSVNAAKDQRLNGISSGTHSFFRISMKLAHVSQTYQVRNASRCLREKSRILGGTKIGRRQLPAPDTVTQAIRNVTNSWRIYEKIDAPPFLSV